MGFSKATDLQGIGDPYRTFEETLSCAYPSCSHKEIKNTDDVVIWDGAALNINDFNDRNLTPLAKLAVTSNPTTYAAKFNHYAVRLAFHPECAAEFGMHLIKDTIVGDNVVGRKLRGTRNALREQKTPI